MGRGISGYTFAVFGKPVIPKIHSFLFSADPILQLKLAIDLMAQLRSVPKMLLLVPDGEIRLEVARRSLLQCLEVVPEEQLRMTEQLQQPFADSVSYEDYKRIEGISEPQVGIGEAAETDKRKADEGFSLEDQSSLHEVDWQSDLYSDAATDKEATTEVEPEPEGNGNLPSF